MRKPNKPLYAIDCWPFAPLLGALQEGGSHLKLCQPLHLDHHHRDRAKFTETERFSILTGTKPAVADIVVVKYSGV